jgi:hypothetical protein
METLITFLTTLNSLSPLAVIALLGTIIFLLVKGKTAADGKVDTIASNHLHELPEIAETLRVMAETLRRMETKMSEEFAYLRGKLNGRSWAGCYFGTLKTAIRFLPKFLVQRRVPTNTRLRPLVVASRQLFPFVIRSPRRALTPSMMMRLAIPTS